MRMRQMEYVAVYYVAPMFAVGILLIFALVAIVWYASRSVDITVQTRTPDRSHELVDTLRVQQLEASRQKERQYIGGSR